MRWATAWIVVTLLPCALPAIVAAGESPAEKIVAGDLRYPGAKDVTKSGNGPAPTTLTCVVQESTDEVAKVVKYYRAVLGIDDLAEVCAMAGSKGTPQALVVFVAAGSKSKSGAVSVVATCKATFQKKNACVTVVIVRPPDSKVTTITVNHLPLGELKR
jgi:hypothetical protein